MGIIKYWRIGLLGTLISALAVYFIINQINLDLFGKAWTTARYWFVMPCVFFLLLGLVSRALRWQVLLNHELPLIRAFSIMNAAYLVNGVLPLRIGEVVRVYLASRVDPPVPMLKSASTIIVERLLDLLAVAIMLGFALASGPMPEQLRLAGLIVAPAALLGFLTLVFLAGQRTLLHRILNRVVRYLPFVERLSVTEWLDHFLDGLLPLVQPKMLLRALSWTAVSWGFSVIAGYILMFAFYDQSGLGVTTLYIAAAALAIAVPAVPGNVGTYEASILLALGAMGYGQDSRALAFAVMVHGVNVAVHALTGIIGFIQEGVSLEQLSQGVRKMQQNAN